MKVKDLEEQKQRLVEQVSDIPSPTEVPVLFRGWLLCGITRHYYFVQVYEAEKRYQAKENEFMAYKEQQLTKPEVKLESEINLLKMEKVNYYYERLYVV